MLIFIDYNHVVVFLFKSSKIIHKEIHMPHYQINIKKLQKIADPFTSIVSTEQQSILNKETLQNFINNNDIFPVGDEQDIYRSIAYAVYNPGESIVNIDLSNKEHLISDGVAEYAGSIYRGDDTLTAHVVGNDMNIDDAVNVLLSGIPTQYYQVVDNTVQWDVSDIDLQYTWKNPEYVINAISQRPRGATVKLIDPALSENEAVIEKIISHQFSAFDLPEHILNSDTFIKSISEKSKITVSYWNFYSAFYNENEIHDKNTLSGKIYTHLFSNVDNAMNVMEEEGRGIADIFKLFSEDVRCNLNIIRLTSLAFRTYNTPKFLMQDFLPESFFTPENVDYLISKYKFALNDLPNHPQMYKSWINDPSKIVDIIANSYFDAHELFSVLPETMKNNVDVVNGLITQKIDIYFELNKDMQNNWDVLENVLFYQKNEFYEKMDKSILFSQTDPDKIEYIVEQYPQTLLEPNCPTAWSTDKNLAVNIAEQLLKSEVSVEKLEVIFRDTELGIKLLNRNSAIYPKLPYSLQQNKEYALIYVEQAMASKQYNSSELLGKLPTTLFNSQDFCINLAKINHMLLGFKKIPEQFFNNKNFMKKIFSGIDNSEISEQVIDYMPRSVRVFLDVNKVKENYSNYFDAYFFQTELSASLENTMAPKKRSKI